MSSQAGVSIVIPNWNHEVLLPRSITSALRAVAVLREQSVPAEVVVVDDYSRDGSLTLLRQLEATYHRDGLRVLAFGSNGGLAASRNQALAHARFPYVTFLDADNELIPENLPYLLRTLGESRAAAAYGNLLVRAPASRSAHNIVSNESIQRKLFQGNYVDAFAVFDRLQLLDSRGYDTSFTTWEDFEMWLHLTTNGRRVIFVPMVLGYYYILPSSMALNLQKQKDALARIKRIFNQTNVREFLRMRSDRLRYHPDLGYL